MKEKSLKRVGWVIQGTATMNMWGGGTGEIKMYETTILHDKQPLTKGALLGAVNDGGFGCERIISADIDVYELYNNGFKIYRTTIEADSRYSNDFSNWKTYQYD